MTRLALIIGALSLALSACTQPYVERTTPKNCACAGEWTTPSNNQKVLV